MLDKSLIICYSTSNYSNVTDIFLNSLRELGIPNLQINHKLETPDEELIKTEGFLSELWYYCVFNKVKHLVNTLIENKNKDYKYFIMSDCDIQFIKNNVDEWCNLEIYLENDNRDVYFMQEYEFEDFNTGFYVIKNNQNINDVIEFFNEVLYKMTITKREDMNRGDQTIINSIKHKLNYTLIPSEYIIFGNYIYNKQKSLIHHSVGCDIPDHKIIQLKYIKALFQIDSPINIFNEEKQSGIFNHWDVFYAYNLDK